MFGTLQKVQTNKPNILGESDLVNIESRRSLRTVCSEVLALLASAFLLSMAFPGFMSEKGIGVLALIALIPVFIVIRNTTWRLVWIYGFFFGFSYYIFFNYWLKGFHALAILLVPIIKGGEMVFLFLALKAADSLFRKKGYLLQAVIWVAYAYMSESWFAGYPYGTIAYALYRNRILIQIIDKTGIWGLTFMMVLPQAFIAGYISDSLWVKDEGILRYVRNNIIPLSIYAVLLILSIIYGIVKLSYWNGKEPDRVWRVATVQHNHDSWKGGYNTYLKNFNNLRRYSIEAMTENPDILVWSETAFVPSVSWHTTYDAEGTDWEPIAQLTKDFVSFASSLPVPLLTGNPKGVLKDSSLPPYDENGTANRVDFNTVILFKDGKIAEEYKKQHLVPFTEHFPYEKTMPWLYKILLANDYNWWEKGDESVVFDLDGVHFSTPICFEDVFGYLSAEFVANGADVIVNMTNDNWSKKTSAEMQHAAIATYRSIETRKATVRGTNSGITCLITPTGKIIDPMEPFTMGYHLYEVPVYSSSDDGNTFYVEHIDLFAHIAKWVSLIGLVSGILLRVLKPRKEDKQ